MQINLNIHLCLVPSLLLSQTFTASIFNIQLILILLKKDTKIATES